MVATGQVFGDGLGTIEDAGDQPDVLALSVGLRVVDHSYHHRVIGIEISALAGGLAEPVLLRSAQAGGFGDDGEPGPVVQVT